MKNRLKLMLLMIMLGNIVNAQVIEVNEAVNMALENNLQIKISKDDIKGTEYKKGQTKSLYLPKIKLSGGYIHLNETPDLVQLANKLGQMNNGMDDLLTLMVSEHQTLISHPLSGVDGGTKTLLTGLLPFYQGAANGVNKVELKDEGLNYQSIKLSLEQPLYTGGKITSVNKQVDLSIDISKLESSKAVSDVTFEVKKAYYNVVLARRSLNTVNEIYKGIEKHLEEAKAYYKAGFIAQLDVIRAEAKLSEMRQKVVQAENSVDVAKAYLEFVIGKDLPKDFEPNIEIPLVSLDKDLESFQALALNNRVELKIYANKLKLAQENKKIMKSQNKPLIALQGEYKYEGTDLTKEDAKWQIGIVGTWTAFDGGSTSSQIKEAQAVVDKAENGVELVTDSIKIEVKKAYLDTINALETIKVTEKSIEQAKELNRMAQVNFTVGTGSSLERLDAQLFLEQIQNSYDNALNQYVISKSNLEKAVGIYY